MRITIVGADKPIHEQACTHWSGLKSALTRSGWDWSFVSCRYNPNYVNDIIASKPDVIVYGLIDMMRDTQARERIREALPNAIICMWYGDLRDERTGQDINDLSETVDRFFVSNDGQKDFIKQQFNMTPEFLPLAVDPVDEPVVDDSFKEYFVFIGAKGFGKAFAQRGAIIQHLESNMKLKRIDGNTPEQRAEIYWNMPKIYGNAQFTLDISHFWDIEKYVSNRYWVIPGYFGFPLTKRFPGHEELYPETVRVYWDSIEELQEKMDFYKKNESERKKMILAGWKHTKDNHTYDHRLKRLQNLLHL